MSSDGSQVIDKLDTDSVDGKIRDTSREWVILRYVILMGLIAGLAPMFAHFYDKYQTISNNQRLSVRNESTLNQILAKVTAIEGKTYDRYTRRDHENYAKTVGENLIEIRNENHDLSKQLTRVETQVEILVEMQKTKENE